jgi:transcriptional regulator with XRE-family HTH domain
MSENIYQELPQLPGPRLRQLRSSKGLSIKELASEVGTSPSAVHRYESGWGSFELRTLARLAAALGARLSISLNPAARPGADRRLTRGQLVARLRPLFWDVELTRTHLDKNPEWVLRRVLQFGDWDAVHRARLFFGDEAVRRAALHRSMDARTRRFWQVVLGPGEAPQ